MMMLSEVDVSRPARPYLSKLGTGGSTYQNPYAQLLSERNILKAPENVVEPSLSLLQIGICQNGTKTSNYFVVGIALAGFYMTGATCLKLLSPKELAWPNSSTPAVSEYKTITSIPESTISQAAKLISEAQAASGLTLEEIAPLLGVSRRSIQYWKDGERISAKNETQLRNLVEALTQIFTGSADETRGLLLTRIAGVPRIYDLLAERRYDAAVLRAKSPSKHKPILSDPTIKFEHRPIEDQLAIVDDGPAEFKGKLNRSMSRRIVR